MMKLKMSKNALLFTLSFACLMDRGTGVTFTFCFAENI